MIQARDSEEGESFLLFSMRKVKVSFISLSKNVLSLLQFTKKEIVFLKKQANWLQRITLFLRKMLVYVSTLHLKISWDHPFPTYAKLSEKLRTRM